MRMILLSIFIVGIIGASYGTYNTINMDTHNPVQETLDH